MLGAALALAVVFTGAPDRSLRLTPSLAVRLVSGSEWDTNARRAVSSDVQLLPGASLPSVVVGDALVRVVVDATAGLDITPADRLQLSYALGAKRFFNEHTEDLLAHDLLAESSHGLLDALDLVTQGRLRASRIRSGARDYTIASGGGGAVLRPLESWSLSGRGRYEFFGFGTEADLTWRGPVVSGDVTFRPTRKLSVGAYADFAWRRYDGNALIEIPGTGGQAAKVGTLCVEGSSPCVPVARRDTELMLGGRVFYKSGFVLSLDLTVRLQRSNSDFERIDRYRASALATIPLPLELVVSVMGSLQYNKGLSVTETKYLVEDDENQNSLEVQLTRRITEELGVDVRYSLYANGFATAHSEFLRQTVYAGLSYELGHER